MQTDECLDEHAALDYLAGRGDRTHVAEHLEHCADCRAVLHALARLSGSPADDATLPALATSAPSGAPDRIGRFVIVDVLGAGAMGIVYRAQDPDLRRPVAIKVVKGAAASEIARSRMMREAQAMAQLDHPNVIRVYEVGTDAAGAVFIAMEFIAGTTLAHWLREPRPWQDVVDAFLQAGRGLAAAHSVGVVHRDFKPDNVLVDRSDRVKVGDFGLARADSASTSGEDHAGSPLGMSMTQTGAVLGTPRYMSPEQLAGQTPDARGDQFALCVALYEAIYGAHPFPALDLAELRAATRRGAPTPKARGPARVLWPALRRGLATSPGERFESIDQLLAAIGRALRSRRRRRATFAAAAALLLVGGTAAAVAMRDGPPPDPIEGVWSTRRAAAVREAMQRSQRPAKYVGEQANRTLARLDGWIADWRTASRTIAADGDASAAVARHRKACLDQRLRALEVVVDALVTTGDQHVDDVGRTLAVLRDPRACTTAVPAQTAIAPRPGAEPRVATLAATVEIAELDATQATTLDRLEPEIRTLGYPPLLVKLLLARGSIAHVNHHDAVAMSALTEAARLAATTGDGLLETRVLTQLIEVTSANHAALTQAQTWATAAEAALARVRGNTALPANEVARSEMSLAKALANLADARGDRAAARHHRERWVEMAKRGAGERSEAYGNALLALGIGLMGSGELAKARESFDAALTARRAALGPVHPQVAEVLVAGSNLKILQSEADAARSDLQAALAILDATSGPKDRARVEALFGLAQLDDMAGNHAAVLQRTAEIIDIQRAAFGPDSPYLDRPLLLRGYAQLAMGDVKSARATAEQAAVIVERTYGKDHSANEFPLVLRASIELSGGDYAAARKAFARALAIRTAPNPIYDLQIGELDLIEHDYKAALQRYREIERIGAAQWGARSEVVAHAVGGQGRALLGLGKPGEALPLLETAAAIAHDTAATGVAIGGLHVALSRAVLALKKDRTRAIELARAAHEELLLQKNQPGGRPALADATAWLDELSGEKRSSAR
jgi:eukaryotic-like serine/threonine-protein kinase